MKIDSEVRKLMQELECHKKDRIKEIQRVIDNLEQHTLLGESLAKYTQELINKGRADDIAQQVRALHNRYDEVMTIDNFRREISDLGSMAVTLQTVEIPADATGCLIGKIKRQHATGNWT
jgi:hypothetical protein